MNGFLNMEEMMKNKSPKEIALSVVNKLNLPVFPWMENKNHLKKMDLNRHQRILM